MKNFLLIILCALSVPCIPTPGSSSPVQFAHTLTVNVKKVSKLPDGQDHIQFPADDFLDFYHTKQSPQAVLCSKNEFLKSLSTQIQSRITSLRAAKITRKTEIYSATITLPELPFTFCVKYTLRKQGSEIHIVLSAFVPTSTDAKILSVVTNFCNAQVPVLSFFQKNKKNLLTLASVMGAAVVGFFVTKEIKRQKAIRREKREEEEFANRVKKTKQESAERPSKNKEALLAFKNYLTTTPFLIFAHSHDRKEFPDLTAAANIIAKYITQYIPEYNNRDFFSTEETLTHEELKELATGCFKASTINLLSQFQEDYMIALAKDGYNPDIIENKMSVIEKFFNKLTALKMSDAVEYKRIFFFKPMTIYHQLLEQDFYKKNKKVWPKQILTIVQKTIVPTDINAAHSEGRHFGLLLRRAFLPQSEGEAYCIKDHFPCDFAIFKDLHKVKLPEEEEEHD